MSESGSSGEVVPIPTLPVVTLMDDAVTVDTAFKLLTFKVENTLVPEPVPGIAPLIEETVILESDSVLEVIVEAVKVEAVAVEIVLMVLP
jgi:hypothetical protein